MPRATNRYSLGFDFGTESVRVLIVDIRDGQIAAEAVRLYEHGVLDTSLPDGRKLPPDYALQHPGDWLIAAAGACRAALSIGTISPQQIIGIGVDFTSCTVLPALANGTPLCLVPRFASVPFAWPKLPEHRAAKPEADRMSDIARQRCEPWLARYGGNIGIEWFFPKILETLNHAPQVYDAAEIWLEAADWFVWQLVNGPFPACSASHLPRSTCQAGFKALWNRRTGYPPAEYFAAVHPKLGDVVKHKMPGRLLSPGRSAGNLSDPSAELFGLKPGTPVSAAIIDAHAGVPGAGIAAPSTMLLVIGPSSCHLMNSRIEKFPDGIIGVVEDGILPGYFGYETGHASVSDALAQLAQTLNLSQDELTKKATELPPGSNGVTALDSLKSHGASTMDPRLSGAFIGLTPATRPEQFHRALIETTAYGLRRIVETLREAGVPVRRFVASGSLPAKSPLLMQIYADVLNEKIPLARSDQSCALGAAILGCLAAGPEITGYPHISQAIQAMSPQPDPVIYRPDLAAKKQYDQLYALYRSIAVPDRNLAKATRALE